jgi:hypothetical protein
VPAVLGAVYNPDDDTVPPVALQVTAVFVEPDTVAENCCVPPVVSDAEVGEIAIVMSPRPLELTETVAEADFVVSAALVAVTE